eukprot:6202019-Pleurochrysis_carterae.AAC.4
MSSWLSRRFVSAAAQRLPRPERHYFPRAAVARSWAQTQQQQQPTATRSFRGPRLTSAAAR